MKTVLDLGASNARNFFLQEKNYFTGDLPRYFSFESMLQTADNMLNQYNGLSGIWKESPSSHPNVNYDIVINKDGAFDWRKLTIINPLLYVDLVNYICTEDVWESIKRAFQKFQSQPNIICASVPAVPTGFQKQKSAQIKRWKKEFENYSIKQALTYSSMACTDITNCYASLYTHVIAWALHGETIAKRSKTNKKLVGNVIDEKLRSLSYGQTNGIPQGSVLMDFIAEIVLGYVDWLIGQAIQEEQIEDYKILRYRDDYRIFANNTEQCGKILKIISDICLRVGFRLNPNKTIENSDIVWNSVKQERFMQTLELQKDHLSVFLQLYKFSKDFPHSGGIQTQIMKINKNLKISSKEDHELLISILTGIAYNNPKTIPQVCTIISKILDKTPKKLRLQYINKIRAKFDTEPYTDFVHIWLQRLSVNIEPNIKYTPKICDIILNPKTALWDMGWLQDNHAKKFERCSILQQRKLRYTRISIPEKETNIFVY